MAIEKKPSIYADRGTIGSSAELDEYGVWVKSEPQDLQEITADVLPDNSDFASAGAVTDVETETDADISGLDGLPDFDDGNEALSDASTEDEFEIPEMDQDEELPDITEDLQISSYMGDDTAISESGELGFSEVSIDEMENPVDFTGLTDAGADLAEPSLDISDADFADALDLQESDELSESEDLSDSIDLSETGELPDSGELQETGELADSGISEGELSESQDFMDSVDFSDSDDLADTGDFSVDLTEDITPGDSSAETFVPDDLQINNEPVRTADSADLSTQLLLRIAEELSTIRTEITNLKRDFAGLQPASPEKQPESEHEHEHKFLLEEDDEKIALTGDELNNILNTADFTEETGTDATGEIPNIPEPPANDDDSETFSINDLDGGLDLNMELGENDLDELGGEFNPAGENTEDISEENIDDIFEEKSEENTEEIFDDFTIENAEEITNESDGEISEEIFEENTGENADETELPDFDMEAGSELLNLRDEGAHHMTAAPEPGDADYLEDDPMINEDLNKIFDDEETDIVLPDIEPDDSESSGIKSAEDDESADVGINFDADESDSPEFDPADSPENESGITLDESLDISETLDLSDAVIDEPDLSMDIQDNPVEEPALDNIAIDLDLDLEESFSEEESEDLDDAENPEETMEIPSDEPINEEDSEEDDLALIPEGFVIDDTQADEVPDDSSYQDSIDNLPVDDSEDLTSADELSEDELPVDEEPDEIKFDDILAEEAPETPGLPKEHIPSQLKQELKTVLAYMDKLLESLPDDKIEEFAKSEHFDTYKKLFRELGLT